MDHLEESALDRLTSRTEEIRDESEKKRLREAAQEERNSDETRNSVRIGLTAEEIRAELKRNNMLVS